ncbi:MAG TPA: hypothetical protein VH741_06975 [Candidatus Limnocylindrales bacterium]
MSDPREPGHPTGPESDDSQNPTAAAPTAGHAESRQQDMLRQLQQMIDQLAAQAGPPMREIAAKAAELAALAAQRAGPLAVKAAEKTQVYGERFAARSKEVAAELRSSAKPGAAEESEPDMSTPENAG